MSKLKDAQNNENKDQKGMVDYEHKILDVASVGILITRISDGTILYANKMIARLLGIENAKSVVGTPVPNFYWEPKDRQMVLERFRAEGSVTDYELRARRADDSMLWVSISLQPFNFEGEQVLLSEITDITERKKAEQAQWESEEQFRSLYNNSTIGLYRTTPDGQILMINPTGLHLLGFDTFEELAKRNLEEAGFEEVDARKNFREKLEREGILEQESIWTRKDGTPIFVRESSTVSRDENGNILYYDGSFEDITAHKQAEEALRASEERFKRFTEVTVEGLVFHEQGKIIDANPAGLAMFGLTDNAEFIGRNLLEFIAPESHKTVLQQMQLETVLPYEIQCVRQDGAAFPVETSTRTYKEGERIIRASSIRNITERKKAEERIRIFQAMAEASTDAIFMADPNTTEVLYANAAALQVYQMSEMVGTLGVKLWPEERVPFLQEVALPQIMDTGWKGEAPQVHGDGSIFDTEVTAFTLRNATNTPTHLVVTVRDITERKQLEQQVQEAFERRGYQVQVSTEISQEVASATELSNLFERVVTLTKERLGYYHTQLLRYDATRDAVVLINGYGEIGQKMLAGGHQMPMGEGLIGTAAASGETVLRPTLADDPDWHPNPLLPDTQGEIAVPIKWQNTVLGVLDVQSNQAGALSDEDRLLFEGLCGQIAIAMHSAELVEAVHQNEAKLAEALEIARLAHWEYDVEKDIFTFNDQFYSLFHTTAEKAGGYQLPSAYYAQNLVYSEDLPIVGAEIEKALNSTGRHYSRNIEHRMLYADGGVGHMQVNINVERDENGKITRYYGANQDITERKLAETALRDNEAKLAEALEIARLAHWEYDVEKDIFTFNDQFYSLFHTTAEKAGGYQLPSAYYAQNLVYSEDLPIVGAEIEKALNSTGRHYSRNIEHRMLYADGGVGHMQVNINVERDENGKITRYYGANQDITERKQAETALRDNEAKLAEALLAARLANWEYDVEKDIFTFNDHFYSIFHTTVEKAGGYHLSSARYAELFVHPDDMEVVGAEIGKALSSTERVYNTTIDHRIRYEDGGVGYIMVQLTVERDENGKITRYYGANQDITERKQAEEALRVNEARLSEALLAARLANWEYDVEKDIFTFNDQFYSIFHTTVEKAGGYHLSSARYAELFVHPDDMEVVGAEIGKALSSTDRVYNTTIDHRIRYEDGGVGYITVQLTVERDENGKITRYYGANQDITERKQAEEALRVNEARLSEALRAARLGNWEYDVEKDIFTFNDQFYAIFHTTVEKAGGYQLSSARYAELFVHPDDMELVGGEIGKALSSTERVYNTTLDHRILYADGGVGYITVQLTVERDENGKITRYYGANQDITERHKAQEEMAERLEEINRLYSSMSREGWKTYRETAELPKGFIFDQAGVKPVGDMVLADENFAQVPMKVLGGEVVGTLSVANDPRNPTSLEDLVFLQQVSDQVALALEGARLTAQTQSALAQSEILFESSRRLGQVSDLQELLKTAIETFNIPVINGAELDMFNYDSEGELESLAVAANWWNGTGKEPGAVGSRYPKAMFSAIKLFLTTTPVSISDALDSERVDASMLRIVQAFNIRAVTFLPLFVGTHQIGVLVMHAEEPHDFTEEETRLFSGLAPQIATVLENRRQFERAQQQAEREGMLNIISQKIQSATSVEAVLQIAARELGHALGAPMTIAQLSMKDKK